MNDRDWSARPYPPEAHRTVIEWMDDAEKEIYRLQAALSAPVEGEVAEKLQKMRHFKQDPEAADLIERLWREKNITQEWLDKFQGTCAEQGLRIAELEAECKQWESRYWASNAMSRARDHRQGDK